MKPMDIMHDLINALGPTLVNEDADVTSAMAETNAFGYGLDTHEVLRAEELADGRISFRADLTISGEHDSDRPYCGDQINLTIKGHATHHERRGWEINTYEIVTLNSNAFAEEPS